MSLFNPLEAKKAGRALILLSYHQGLLRSSCFQPAPISIDSHEPFQIGDTLPRQYRHLFILFVSKYFFESSNRSRNSPIVDPIMNHQAYPSLPSIPYENALLP